MAVLLQPFALTLYAWLQLQERDRIQALRDRERDIYRGELAAMAMNEPKRLGDERSDVVAEMRAPAVVSQRRKANDELRAAGEALIARLEAGRVLEDGR